MHTPALWRRLEHQELLDPLSPEATRVRRAWPRLLRDDTYWGRVWVLQEVNCAKTCIVVAGALEADLDDLVRMIPRALSQFKRGYLDPASWNRDWPLLSTLVGLRPFLKANKCLSFPDLLRRSELCKFTREVDQIYGFLGLASRLDPDFEPSDLEVDYDKSFRNALCDVAYCTTKSIDVWRQPVRYELDRITRFLWHTGRVHKQNMTGALEIYSFASTTSTKRTAWAKSIGYVYGAIFPFHTALVFYHRKLFTMILSQTLDHALDHARPQSCSRNEWQREEFRGSCIAWHVLTRSSNSWERSLIGLSGSF